MGRFAFMLTFEFIVTLPNHPTVFAGGVPHLGAKEGIAVTADNAGGKNALPAILAADSLAPLKFGLHLVELLWRDNRLMAVLHIILWNFALVHFLLFSKEIDGEALLVEAGRVELPSERTFPRLSTSVVYRLNSAAGEQ